MKHPGRSFRLPLLLFSLALARCSLAQDITPAPEASSDPMQADSQLVQLAHSQERNGELDLSKESYAKAIERIETREGVYSEHLIDPLIGLGRVCLAQGQYDEAEDNLRHAQHLSHRAEGVDTTRQLPILDLMTRLDMERGEPLDADREQRFELFINEHQYGDDQPELLPALYKLAEWYLATGQFVRAHMVYNRAVDIVEAHFGDEDLRLILPYRGIARARQLEGSSKSFETLEQALAILGRKQSDPDETAQVMAELGDAYTLAHKPDEARAIYLQAWQKWNEAGLDQPRQELFAQPVPIEMSRLLSSLSPNEKSLKLDDEFLGQRMNLYGTPLPGRNLRTETDDEIKLSDQRPPQVFTVTGGDRHYRYQIRDLNEQTPADEKMRLVIGSPLQFLLPQLQFVLPGGLQDPEKIAELFVSVEFGVDPNGEVVDPTVIETNAPGKLARVVTDALERSRYRPRIANGEPVATEHLKIRQEFK